MAISHLPGHGEVAGGALSLADEAHDVALGLVLVERRVGDHGSAWNTKTYQDYISSQFFCGLGNL